MSLSSTVVVQSRRSELGVLECRAALSVETFPVLFNPAIQGLGLEHWRFPEDDVTGSYAEIKWIAESSSSHSPPRPAGRTPPPPDGFPPDRRIKGRISLHSRAFLQPSCTSMDS